MKRVLFVDDEQSVLDGLRRTLHSERGRWDMQFVTSGEAALSVCENSKVDVVISDMRMPGMDGATLLGHIRSRFPDTARLILSGYAEVTLATRAVGVAYRVLTKPCTGTELQTTIERLCALQDVLGSPEIRRVIGAIGELPSLSTIYKELADAVKDPATSLTRVGNIIGQDVAMSAKVLQLANSGFFGSSQKVTSLQRAVAYLGMETITNLALVSETFTVFRPDKCISESFCESLQRRAHNSAIIANGLPVDRKIRENTAIAALLHDIGTLALVSKMPDEFCKVTKMMKERGCEQFEAEEELLGITHAEIGAYLLGLWGINSMVVEAIAHHHRPSRIAHEGFDCSAAVYVADLLARSIEEHPDDGEGHLSEADRAQLESLGLLESFPGFKKAAIESLHNN